MKKGLFLVAVYGVITVITILAGTLVCTVSSEKQLMDRNRWGIQARYLAESGLDRGFLWLKEQSSPPSGTAVLAPEELQDVTLSDGTFSVSVDPYDNNTGEYLKRYRIVSTAAVNGVQRQLSLDVVTDTFARYAYFTDSEIYNPPWSTYTVWFTSSDHLRGPVHTNDRLHIYGDPVFDAVVRTVDDEVEYYNGGPPADNPEFNGGLEMGVDTINFPLSATSVENAAGSGGLTLSGTTTIVLNDDGTMNVTNAAEGWVNQNMSLPANGALFVTGGDLRISGTLNGQLTAATDRNIVISQDIVYADDPRVNSASTDMLGLIAEQDVVIDHDASYDLEIDAAVMALGSNFIYDEWWNGPVKGTLTVLGGIIQQERGPVGTFNSSTGAKATGYSKDYIYDERLKNQTPPYFPLTDEYVVVLWQKNT